MTSCRQFFVLLLLAFSSLFAGTRRAASFTAEQHALLDHVVDTAQTGERQYADNLDTMLNNLATAFRGSGYAQDPGSLQIAAQLREQAARLKEEIAKVDALVSAHRAEDHDPAVMLLLLSREQTLSFHLYKWLRTATELTDLANASTRRQDLQAAKFTTQLIETSEADQETLSTAIQGITGALGHAKP